jgi:hypothetical protein
MKEVSGYLVLILLLLLGGAVFVSAIALAGRELKGKSISVYKELGPSTTYHPDGSKTESSGEKRFMTVEDVSNGRTER